MPKLSDDFNDFIAEKYPHLEQKVKDAFGMQLAKPTNEMKQTSLDSKATIDANLNKLVDVINNPDTTPENKTKALSAYKMIFDKMNTQKSPEQPKETPIEPSTDTKEDAQQGALKRLSGSPSKDNEDEEYQDENPLSKTEASNKEFQLASR